VREYYLHDYATFNVHVPLKRC